MFTTLSTILVPIKTGFTSSLLLEYPLLLENTAIPPLRAPSLPRPREGEHDFCLGFPVLASLEEDKELDAVGLLLDAEEGLLGTAIFKFGGASDDNIGFSAIFLGRDLTAG